MTTGIIQDQNLEKQIEKQMGCMAGFLQLFDRHQLLAGKRLYSTKRLPPSRAVDSTTQSENSLGSPACPSDLQQQQQQQLYVRPSPENVKHSTPEIRSPVPEIPTPVETPVKTPLPLPVFDFKEGLRSSWKFKEAPRLSLDSRASVDGKGKLYPREIQTNAAIFAATQCSINSEEAASADDNDKQRRSPSVIARLMGLEVLPDSGREPLKKAEQPELRRSASESRVSRDLLQYRFVDGNNFQMKQPCQTNFRSNVISNAIRDNKSNVRTPDFMDFCVRKPKHEQPKSPSGCQSASTWKAPQQRKSFFDAQDFFPEPKQTGSLYGEIEKRLKMRGIDEPAKDLETLKQILEALQLKGLLHSKKSAEQQIGHRNFIYDRKFYAEDSPIVVMKPSRSPISTNRARRTTAESPPQNFRSKAGLRRNLNLASEASPPVKPRGRPELDRNLQNERKARSSMSPDRNESSARSPSSLARRKPLSIDFQRRANDPVEQQRRTSPIHSPKINSKKVGSDQTTSRSPRNRKRTPEISPKERISSPTEDQSSTISESSISTSSLVDAEGMQSQRSKMEACNQGRSLLERCDKLLHSIAVITATELQPSPVSVLDSSFYKDESSPSPVLKRCIDFKDESGELEDENWSPVVSPVRLKFEDKTDDSDFLYISDMLRASNCLPEDSDVFLLLEKQYYKGDSSSKASALHRKLVFDTTTEILDRKRQLPPWKAFTVIGKASLQQVWSEFRRIRERDPAEDLVEVICGVLRKDMAGDAVNGWGDCPEEMSEAVLDIERMIFKDLVAETIRDLAAFAGKIRVPAPPRRKLVF